MSELIHYQIQQLVDNGQTVQLTLTEDVQTEPAKVPDLFDLASSKVKKKPSV